MSSQSHAYCAAPIIIMNYYSGLQSKSNLQGHRNIHTGGHIITPSQGIKILGVTFQPAKKNTTTNNKVKTMTDQVTQTLKRISKKRGMGESDTLRLVLAFIISRIIYALSYAQFLPLELKKLDSSQETLRSSSKSTSQLFEKQTTFSRSRQRS
ncbi:hypothetical protein HPB48_013538 [Haemaphysalis longicornis]|uniref:Uncharacterized protein n=1 Tax=Haemaphysalis longicornis TaxID=44386 RepID=A0A9J6H630_HAELO|nr:hypothetical protein HPB48_013538 [Haemaphysalis longicornis]